MIIYFSGTGNSRYIASGWLKNWMINWWMRGFILKTAKKENFIRINRGYLLRRPIAGAFKNF